jgi:hypothetical protein
MKRNGTREIGDEAGRCMLVRTWKMKRKGAGDENKEREDKKR